MRHTDYETAMARLARHEIATGTAALRRILDHDARLDGLNRTSRLRAGDTLERAVARYRTLLASHAAFARPGVLDATDADAPAEATVALARDAVLWGRSVWDRTYGAKGSPDRATPLADMPFADLPFADRYLARRLGSVADPKAHAALLDADPDHRVAALALASWWTERLLDLALAPDRRVPLRPGQAEAFRIALAETVTLYRPEEVAMGYEPGIHLRIALAEANLPGHALDGWRHSAAWIAPDGSGVSARIGDSGRTRTVLAPARSCAPAAADGVRPAA